ncbi:MCE family protein [Thermoleophilia bacterium SCSIO 60948]|nr:MCE family protein [Thermoleophilia bacterium SCSIO 60948]
MSAPADQRASFRRRRVTALACVAVAVLGAWLALGGAAGSRQHVVAEFERVDGLVVGAEVEAWGSPVGEVASIGLGAGGLPEVELEIDPDVELREGAGAELRAGSASGQLNRYVILYPGDGEPLGEEVTLADTETAEPVRATDVLASLRGPVRRDAGRLLDGLEASLRGRGDELEATLRHSSGALGRTADLLAQVNADREALRGLVSDGGSLLAELEERRDELGGTAERLAVALRTAAARSAEIESAAELLPETLHAPRLALERTRAASGDLRGLVADAGPGVARIGEFARELRPTLVTARPALDDAARLASAAPPRLRSLTSLAERLRPTLTRLDSALTEAGPVLDEARVRTPDFFSFFANWADFTSVYDANGHGARVGIVLPPAPENRIEGDENGAGSLAEPFLRTPGVLEGDPWRDYRDSFLSEGEDGR